VFPVADILDRVAAKFCELEIEYDCLGGGRIDHKKEEKSILVYGYSMVSQRAALKYYIYCRADHSVTVGLLKEQYPDYGKITFRNEGY